MIRSLHPRQAKVIVQCPDDLPSTIFYLRSLALIARQYDSIVLIDKHHLAELIVPLYPNITVDAELRQTDHDITYSLADLSHERTPLKGTILIWPFLRKNYVPSVS